MHDGRNMTDKISAARRASRMTVDRAADLAGVTAQTIIAREKDPTQWRLCELKGMYQGLDDIGKKLFKDGVNEIFLP